MASTDELESGIDHLTRHRLLTAEEEVALARRVKVGDQQAKDQFVLHNIRLVCDVAKHYLKSGMPHEDLVQEGVIGLMTAVDRFDPERGYRFATYATHWIKQAIARAIDNKRRAIRIPAHVSATLREIKKVSEALIKTGQHPTTSAIAEALGISVRKLLLHIEISKDILSLSMSVGSEGNSKLEDLIQTDNFPVCDPALAYEQMESKQRVETLLACLNPREQQVMRSRIGNDDDTPERLVVIGQKLHVSRQGVHLIELRAIKKLRNRYNLLEALEK